MYFDKKIEYMWVSFRKKCEQFKQGLEDTHFYFFDQKLLR